MVVLNNDWLFLIGYLVFVFVGLLELFFVAAGVNMLQLPAAFHTVTDQGNRHLLVDSFSDTLSDVITDGYFLDSFPGGSLFLFFIQVPAFPQVVHDWGRDTVFFFYGHIFKTHFCLELLEQFWTNIGDLFSDVLAHATLKLI